MELLTYHLIVLIYYKHHQHILFLYNPEMMDFELADFTEKTMGKDADAHALAFVGIRTGNETKLTYGAGEHTNIDRAAIAALITALNRVSRKK